VIEVGGLVGVADPEDGVVEAGDVHRASLLRAKSYMSLSECGPTTARRS
jgi:hypothetical protein